MQSDPPKRHEFRRQCGTAEISLSHSDRKSDQSVRSSRRSASVQSRLELHLCQAPQSRRADAIRGWCQQFNPRYEEACQQSGAPRRIETDVNLPRRQAERRAAKK
jgi:hypothetical protein